MAGRRDTTQLVVVLVAVPVAIALVVGIVLVGTGRIVHRTLLTGTAVGMPVAHSIAPFEPPAVLTTSAPPTTTTSPTTTPVVGDESSAQNALNQEVAQDKQSVEALVGSWVPQLSSKRPGIVANGVTYDYLAIWQDFQSTRSRYPNALLLWSGNYVSYASGDFWVTIVPNPFSDGASANSWCDSQQIGPNDCFAKFLSHTGGSTGTTVLRN